MGDLRKLYYRYRSNANILKNSPYYTNRQQQKQLVAYIKSHRYDLHPKIMHSLSANFALTPQQEQELEGRKGNTVKVHLMMADSVHELELEVRSVLELEGKLKKEHALIEYQAQGKIAKSQNICGFESVQGHPIIDYQLSLKESALERE